MTGELPVTSIEKMTIAKQMLAEAKSLDDILKVNDLAEAAVAYAKAANLGTEAQNAAAEIALRAKRKAGDVLAQLERATPQTAKITSNDGHDTPYGATLEESGTTRQDANRWQTIAKLPEEQFEQFIEEAKDDGREITTSAVVKFAKQQQAKEKADAAPLPSDKYRVIYADPPWKYGDTLIDGYGPAEFHYPSMTISELCALPVTEMAAEDAVLFLWVTSPMLEDAFKIVKAWGFEYKASFVWDKVKHNYGHYNSVRHEFLLVCTRGSATPDSSKLFDSVQVIERTNNHSQKPEQFRDIIDTLYDHGKRIELFARRPVDGWEVWGNEPAVITVSS